MGECEYFKGSACKFDHYMCDDLSIHIVTGDKSDKLIEATKLSVKGIINELDFTRNDRANKFQFLINEGLIETRPFQKASKFEVPLTPFTVTKELSKEDIVKLVAHVSKRFAVPHEVRSFILDYLEEQKCIEKTVWRGYR